MRKRSMLLLTGAVALVASLIVGPAATAKSERQSAGTVIIGHHQEPVTLNFYITEGNAYTTSLAMNPCCERKRLQPEREARTVPRHRGSEDRQVEPAHGDVQLQADREVERRQADHRCRLRGHLPDDHEPELRHHVARGLGGHPEIKATGKNVTVTWKKGKAYAAWDALVATSPMPAQGRWAELQRPVAQLDRHRERPVQVAELAEGHADGAVKNNQFTAGPKAKVDRVVFRYIPSTPSLFQALNSGEIQVTEPQPQLQIVDIRKTLPKFKVQSGPGYFWEHMDIQSVRRATRP